MKHARWLKIADILFAAETDSISHFGKMVRRRSSLTINKNPQAIL
jgi:hypothetical protein